MKTKLAALLGFVIRHRAGVALAFILVLAIGFRFWQLHDLPPGLYEDEAANGLDIFRIQEGQLQPFYATNNGREALFFYLQAGFVWLFGNTILALRLAPALIGVLTVLLTYLWVKEWFSKRTALLAALFTATGSWAVTISRNGFRASMVPLMIALLFWSVTRAIQTRKWYWYVVAGASFGAGFYTYLAYRFMILVVLVVGISGLWRWRSRLKEFVKPLLIFGVSTVLVLVPLGLYAFRYPDQVLATRSSVSFTNPEINHGQPLRTLATSAGKTALMFNIQGDPNYRHNLGGAPMLDGLVGVMFLLGGLISLRRIKDIRYLSLLTIFGIMLLPEVTTAEGIPHALRAIGVLPVVYILAAVGIIELYRRWRVVFPLNPAAQTAALALVISLSAFSVYYNYQRYFVAWANAPATFEAYSEDAVAAADYMIANPDKNYFVVVDINKNRTIEYLTHGKVSYRRLDTEQINSLPAGQTLRIVALDTVLSQAEPLLVGIGAQLIDTGVSQYRRRVILYKVYDKSQP